MSENDVWLFHWPHIFLRIKKDDEYDRLNVSSTSTIALKNHCQVLEFRSKLYFLVDLVKYNINQRYTGFINDSFGLFV